MFPKDREDEEQLFLQAEYYSELTVVITIMGVLRGAQQPEGKTWNLRRRFVFLEIKDFNGPKRHRVCSSHLDDCVHLLQDTMSLEVEFPPHLSQDLI